MILFINTSKIDLIEVKLIAENKIIGQAEHHEDYKQAELLLGIIDKLIKSVKSLKYLAVVSGPGAFSALRLGVATANALACVLKVPIIELSVAQATGEQKLIESINKKIARLTDKRQKDFKPVVPKYGKEPNITVGNR